MSPRHRPRISGGRKNWEPILDDLALNYRRPGPEGECHLVIGLDFGTSATKVVIQAPDLPGSPSFPVDFGPFAHPSSRYLLPTKLWIKGNGVSFFPPQHDPEAKVRPITNIKTALFVDTPASENGADDTHDQRDHEAIAAAYLALVLRYSRKWLLETKSDVVRQFTRFIWSVNMGVPSPCAEDNEEKRAFGRVGKAAWMLSTLPEHHVNLDKARRELDHADEDWDADGDGGLFCDFQIIPEIAAGAVGYAHSALRRDGLHVMVDIGASTVDVCTFVLSSGELGDQYSLLIADVQKLGTARVHRERLAAIGRVCKRHLNRLRNEFEALEPLPDDLERYMIPKEVLAAAVRQAYPLVLEQVDKMLRRTIWNTKLRRHRRAPEWKRGKLPILIIGGGSHVQSFRWSSRPGEFHPQSLTEPNVKVSLHSALVIQSWARAQSASGRIDSAYW